MQSTRPNLQQPASFLADICLATGSTIAHHSHPDVSLACRRADKYSCTQLDSLARDFLRRNFETVVKYNGRPPNRVGLTSLSQSALMQILTDDNLELSCEVISCAPDVSLMTIPNHRTAIISMNLYQLIPMISLECLHYDASSL